MLRANDIVPQPQPNPKQVALPTGTKRKVSDIKEEDEENDQEVDLVAAQRKLHQLLVRYRIFYGILGVLIWYRPKRRD